MIQAIRNISKRCAALAIALASDIMSQTDFVQVDFVQDSIRLLSGSCQTLVKLLLDYDADFNWILKEDRQVIRASS